LPFASLLQYWSGAVSVLWDEFNFFLMAIGMNR
jgi:hypothetical protein